MGHTKIISFPVLVGLVDELDVNFEPIDINKALTTHFFPNQPVPVRTLL